MLDNICTFVTEIFIRAHKLTIKSLPCCVFLFISVGNVHASFNSKDSVLTEFIAHAINYANNATLQPDLH